VGAFPTSRSATVQARRFEAAPAFKFRSSRNQAAIRQINTYEKRLSGLKNAALDERRFSCRFRSAQRCPPCEPPELCPPPPPPWEAPEDPVCPPELCEGAE
jgi:hypothetical protein